MGGNERSERPSVGSGIRQEGRTDDKRRSRDEEPRYHARPPLSQPSAEPTPWEATRRQLEEAELSWLVTVRPDGRPHATPVVAVWVDDALHFTTGDKEQKAANLRFGDRVLLQAGRLDWQGGIDVVVEGRATLATDETLLAQLAAAWRGRWDGRWGYELKDGRCTTPPGSPCSPTRCGRRRYSPSPRAPSGTRCTVSRQAEPVQAMGMVQSLSYSSWRRSQLMGWSPSARPFGARSRIA